MTVKRWSLPMGTKSVLFGAHCWFIHPFFVAWAWKKLYGFPWDPRLWITFFVHDLGYWGKPEMDNEEGENHVHFGADLVGRLFDHDPWPSDAPGANKWRHLCLYHSRFWCKRHGQSPSRLCFADKWAISLTPWWIYLPLTKLSGELPYYMSLAKQRPVSCRPDEPKYASMKLSTRSPRSWYRSLQFYLFFWVLFHRNGRPDHWTPEKV